MKDIQKRFADSLKELMQEKGFKTVKEFSLAVNLPRTSLTGWLNLRRMPNLGALEVLADFFDVALDELCGREIKA